MASPGGETGHKYNTSDTEYLRPKISIFGIFKICNYFYINDPDADTPRFVFYDL